MGLWLKCPGCQGLNPLSIKVCPKCGHDLDKLTAKQRVYVIGSAPAPPAPSPASTTTAPESEEKVAVNQSKTSKTEKSPARQPAKKTAKTSKKKS
jgi:hypothetical protein